MIIHLEVGYALRMTQKSGFATSEFCLVAGAFVATVLNQKLGLGLDPVALGGIFCTIASYVAGRSWVKGRVSTPTPPREMQ
jgi:hypothetical protein